MDSPVFPVLALLGRDAAGTQRVFPVWIDPLEVLDGIRLGKTIDLKAALGFFLFGRRRRRRWGRGRQRSGFGLGRLQGLEARFQGLDGLLGRIKLFLQIVHGFGSGPGGSEPNIKASVKTANLIFILFFSSLRALP